MWDDGIRQVKRWAAAWRPGCLVSAVRLSKEGFLERKGAGWGGGEEGIREKRGKDEGLGAV